MIARLDLRSDTVERVISHQRAFFMRNLRALYDYRLSGAAPILLDLRLGMSFAKRLAALASVPTYGLARKVSFLRPAARLVVQLVSQRVFLFN